MVGRDALEVKERISECAAFRASDSLLRLFPFRSLPCKEKSLWVFALAAQFERAEVFVPESRRHVRFRLKPQPQAIEIINTD
jgi:hypothetical protein